MGLNKKAIYFSTDAVLAAMLLLGGFLFVYELSVTETTLTNIDYLSKDLLTALDAIPIGELNHPFILQEIANGNITNTQNSILEQLAEYWAKGEDAKAQQLANITIDGVLPITIGMKLQFTPDLLYEQLKVGNNSLVASRRMVSGLEKGKPLQGSSSYGYLRNIKDKRSSAYAYYGGFVGQGNVTIKLERLPDDVNTTRIKAITFEADLQRDFTLLTYFMLLHLKTE